METVADKILNVTLLEPKVKHATIFACYDELNEGDSLTIHNDHDPKPLYYQLLAERGNVFTWKYLEEGPVWWKVNIRKRIAGENEETLGEIVANDLRKADIFKRYHLDFCYNGKQTLKDACKNNGLDALKLEQELQQLDKIPAAHPLPYNEWSLDFLADYIINTHHWYVRQKLPDIEVYAQKVTEIHSGEHPELLEIYNLIKIVKSELNEHIEKEENLLFPYIKTLILKTENVQKPPFNSLQDIISNHENEHSTVGRALDSIRKLSNNYTLPTGACASYNLLYRMLDEFGEDLQLHIHLENNILFPKAIELERDNY